MDKWIFGSARKDISWLTLPGLAMAALVHLFHPVGYWDEALAFFALAFCDSGHVYTTLWRTYANAQERRRTLLYWTVPLLIFLFIASWMYLGLPGLWSFIIFLTVFHNYRQFHGILKWEQKVNSNRDPWIAKMAFVLCLVPYVLFHFRDIDTQFMSNGAIWHFPQADVLQLGLGIYFFLLGTFLAKALWSLFQKKINIPVFLAFLTPVFLYGLSFLVGNNMSQILFPLVVAHGIAYMGLMSLSMERLRLPWSKNFLWWILIIATTALFFGALEANFEDWYLPLIEGPKTEGANYLLPLLTGLYLIPLLSHYVFDAWLWKPKHPEAKIIYRSDY